MLFVGPGLWTLRVLDQPNATTTALAVWAIAVTVAVEFIPVAINLGERQRLSRNDLTRAVDVLSSQIEATRAKLLDRGTPFIRLLAVEGGGPAMPAEALMLHRAESLSIRAVLTGRRGAGKSLLLTSVGLDLLDQRNRGDTQVPVPVYLPLTQWLGQEGDLRDWAVGSFAQNALITPELARQLIDSQQALLLFDGLDELQVGPDDAGSIERLLTQLRTWESDIRAPNYVLACEADVWGSLPNSLTADMLITQLLPLTIHEITGAVESIRPQTQLTAEIRRRLRRRSTSTARLLSSPWRLQVMLSLAATSAATVQEFRQWLSSGDLGREAFERYVLLKLSSNQRTLDPEARAQALRDLPHNARYQRTTRALRAIARYLKENAATHRRVSGEALPIEDIVLHELWPLAGNFRPRIVDLAIATCVSLPGLVWLNWLLFPLPGLFPKFLVIIADLAWTLFMIRTTLSAWIPPRKPGRRVTFRSRKFALQSAAALLVGLFCWVYFNSVLVVGAAMSSTWIAIGLTVGFGQTLAPPVNLARVSPDLPLRLERDISVRAAAAAALVIVPGFASVPLWGPVLGGGLGIAYVLVVAFTVASAPYRRYVALILCSAPLISLRPAKLLREAYAAGLLRTAGYAYQFRHVELRDYFAS